MNLMNLMDLKSIDDAIVIYKDFMYKFTRPYYVEMGAKLADNPDDDQILAIVVVKKWHPSWWILKRKMARVDRAVISGNKKGRVS